MRKIVISDTSCLVALSRIGKLDILQKVFSSILTTPEVADEFAEPLPSWAAIKNVIHTNRTEEISRLLDRGEASAIALALETPNAILVIDEKKGRKVALDYGIEIIGTLGILLLAKHKGAIPSVKDVIDSLARHHFRFAKGIVDEILQQANEI